MNETQLRRVDDVGELLTLAHLADIVFYEVAGRRLDEGEESDVVESTTEDAPLQVLLRHDETRLQVRVRCEARSSEAEFTVDVAAQFELSEPVELAETVQREFVERVGIMAAYPFVREGLHSTASKMRVPPPLLQLLRANQMSLTRNEPEAPEAP